MDYYIATNMKQEFEIESIYSVHYFEYPKDFLFFGEKHNFWELLYVDKGEITVQADGKNIVLSRGEMIFHKPNEFHMVIANGIVAPNLVVVSFGCHNPAMSFFNNRIVTLNEDLKKYVSKIVIEAKNAFSCALDNPLTRRLTKRENSRFGCEQLIIAYMHLLLIGIVRMNESVSPAITSTIHQRYNSDIYSRVIDYMEKNIHKKIGLDSIAAHFSISKTSLKSLFREHNSLGIMEYLRLMRIELAKQMIREGTMNFTRISEAVGFSSIHYFSRMFKQHVGMSPTEYATSVKVLVDANADFMGVVQQ